VYDCKLARETKAATILQLSLYSDFLEQIQGILPELMYVVPPTTGYVAEAYRVQDFDAYYRQVKANLEQAVDQLSFNQNTYPEPNPHCEICQWWQECDSQWRGDDHLVLVAGISRLQRKQLLAWGIPTLADLARLPLPLQTRPERGDPEGYVRIREQARVQVESRSRSTPVFELLALQPDRGLTQLPKPSKGDIFFDIEGDPFVDHVGLEYLFGVLMRDESGQLVYHSRWSQSAAEERAAFEWFVDTVMERWSRDPNLHIYHFTAYEPGAIKRLMGRYASREDQVDRMLRASLFVDLHGIIKHAVRAGVEQYSLKSMETLFGFTREVPLIDAAYAKRVIEHTLELARTLDLLQGTQKTVEGYNRDDCRSTLALQEWLEQQRGQLIRAGHNVSRPTPQDGTPPEKVNERQQRVAELFSKLTAHVPVEQESRSEEQAARWLMANLLDWHRREDKAEWWEFFRLKELSDDDLLEEKAAISRLQFIERVAVERNIPIDRYRFERQETEIRAGDELHTREEKIGSVNTINLFACTVDIKKMRKTAEIHPSSVFTFKRVDVKEPAESLFRLGSWIEAHGVDSPGPYRAARDLLLLRRPRIEGKTGADLMLEGEDTLQAARRIAMSIDTSVLPIQGPPGAGKTYTGARMICELVRQGKKVGITALSHKVIRNLLDEALRVTQVRCMQKVKDKSEIPAAFVQETTDNAEALDFLCSGGQILAGTAWLWSRPEFFETVDVLFVDEAGQMSLANVLAVAQAAHSLVLLGDPQQLEQPLKGSHPEGAEVSALEHLLAGKRTITADRGLFLPITWRLHPAICSFTSEAFYEGRLHSRTGLDRQRIQGHEWLAGSGLWFMPVNHEGNQNSSSEEVNCITELVDSLVRSDVTWVDQEGKSRRVELGDILIVAPYNAQVSDLGNRIPGARIGTVDKFQGQEAPVVIYSLTTSSPEEAPRGMEFLYSLHRLNVATSRARAACILVGSPHLFEPECRSPRQIQLANALCRYMEMAKVPDVAMKRPVRAAATKLASTA
jgi:predicted RecB family nuclease